MAPEELDQQRVAFALEQGMIAARLAVPGTAILAFSALPGVGPAGAAAWGGLMIVVLLVRDWMLRKASAVVGTPEGVVPARRALVGSTIVLALVLGLLPALSFSGMEQEPRLVLTVVYCCWVCAGMASLGMSPTLYTVYLALVLGGIAVGWLRSGSDYAPYLVGVMVLYTLVLRAFSRNITRRIVEGLAIRAENAELVRQLQLANEAKTRFIMAASHDLRQPLHAISYLGGVLARARDPQDVRSANEALLAAVEGLNTLFSAVLDLSRIESGAVRTHAVPFKLDRLVAQLDAEYRAICAAAGRPWECHAESATVLSDPAQLERVLRNLLDNAVKHGRSGRVCLAVSVPDGQVVITVSDTGPGIPAHERSRVFDEFYRVNDGGGRPGLGLGLSIVRRLVDRLGCDLEIAYTDPAAERGATIRLRVPRATVAPPETGSPIEGDLTGEEDVAGLAVLVIDNDAAVLHATRALLSHWSCHVATCITPEALDPVLDSFGAPDVALVDYQLGTDFDGLELAARLRQRYPEMGVVMVTAESHPEVRDRLAESGLPVLEKPVSPRELRLTLALFKAAGD